MKNPFARKIDKGEFGFIAYERKRVLIRTILFFAISLAIFLTGYITTHTNRNLLTIVAVLGCLPSCKSLVNFIMFARAKGCSDELSKKIETHVGELIGFYDLYFTTYKVNYPVSHIVIAGQMLIGVTEDSKTDTGALEEHLSTMLLQDGIKNITVKIFGDQDKYLARLDQLNELNPETTGKAASIAALLLSISL